MAEIPCPTCGAPIAIEERAGEAEWLEARCASCAGRIRYRADSPAATASVIFDPVIEYPPGSRPKSARGGEAFSTLFHPKAAFDLEGEDAAAGEQEAAAEPPSETLRAAPGSIPPPALPAAASGAHFVILGAAPGRERIPLRSARTVFGRRDADVDLGDLAVSRRHFQVEATGREFFLRDLGSRNGTFVNGTEARYIELLDGDEVRAGTTFLVFRVGL